MRKRRNKSNAAAAVHDVPSAGVFVQELLENGTVTLRASSREEIAAMTASIPPDIHYGAGGVGHVYESGEYFIILTLTSK